jgi:hypothetical protein
MKRLAFAIATASAIGLSLYGAWETNAATAEEITAACGAICGDC